LRLPGRRLAGQLIRNNVNELASQIEAMPAPATGKSHPTCFVSP